MTQTVVSIKVQRWRSSSNQRPSAGLFHQRSSFAHLWHGDGANCLSCPIIAIPFLHSYVPQFKHKSIQNINTFMTSDPLPIPRMLSICKQCYWRPINTCLFAHRRRWRRCCTGLTCVQEWQVQSQIAWWESTTQRSWWSWWVWCPAGNSGGCRNLGGGDNNPTLSAR